MRKSFLNYFCRSFLVAAFIVHSFSYGQPDPNIRSFMNEEIESDRYVFWPGDQPKFRWKNEAKVESMLGKFSLNIKFFDKSFQPVTTLDKPGRYGAVIEGTTSSGFILKRYVTLFCSPVEYDDYSKNVPVIINQLKEYGIPEKNWKQYSGNLERYSFGNLKYFPQRDADAAIFLAGLGEMDSVPNIRETPRIKDRQWWITMKQKLEGRTGVQNPLQIPEKTSSRNSSEFNELVFTSSEYFQDKIETIRSICREWADKGKSPHVTLVVHKGKIIFHEAFGKDETGASVTTNSMMWMASITKLLSGLVMMQFVDQGLVDLDAPVSRYLPELQKSGNDKLTVRHPFNHTTGLQFAGEWASDWNVALENQIAHILPTVNVGESFSYNRVGYAIAGKIMERISGKAMPYLYSEQIFMPLGMNSAYSDNTYGGLYCTAMDLARLGQMLLNAGTYNGVTLLSKRSFEMMLPVKLPVGDRRWGIGTSPSKGIGLSESAFGHGAASGTFFCVDPQNELIIISARNNWGKSHDEFEKQLIGSITSLIQKK